MGTVRHQFQVLRERPACRLPVNCPQLLPESVRPAGDFQRTSDTRFFQEASRARFDPSDVIEGKAGSRPFADSGKVFLTHRTEELEVLPIRQGPRQPLVAGEAREVVMRRDSIRVDRRRDSALPREVGEVGRETVAEIHHGMKVELLMELLSQRNPGTE